MNANPNDDLTDGLNTWALTGMDALRREADRLVGLYWGWADLQRKARPRSQWGHWACACATSATSARCRAPLASSGSRPIGCRGIKGGGRSTRRYLRRGRGLRYPRSTLSRVAKPWELAMADEFEDHFALIRGLLHSIAQVRKVLRKRQAVERSTAKAKETLYTAYDSAPSAEMKDDRWG